MRKFFLPVLLFALLSPLVFRVQVMSYLSVVNEYQTDIKAAEKVNKSALRDLQKLPDFLVNHLTGNKYTALKSVILPNDIRSDDLQFFIAHNFNPGVFSIVDVVEKGNDEIEVWYMQSQGKDSYIQAFDFLSFLDNCNWPDENQQGIVVQQFFQSLICSPHADYIFLRPSLSGFILFPEIDLPEFYFTLSTPPPELV
jgi:hypothetical protein